MKNLGSRFSDQRLWSGNAAKESPVETFRFSFAIVLRISHPRTANRCYVNDGRHGELAKHLRRYAFSVRRVPTPRRNQASLLLPFPSLLLSGSLGISLTPLHSHAFLFRGCIQTRDARFTQPLLQLSHTMHRTFLRTCGSWAFTDFRTHRFPLLAHSLWREIVTSWICSIPLLENALTLQKNICLRVVNMLTYLATSWSYPE